MIFLRLVNITSGMIANGNPNDKTTWLMTRVRVGSKPIKITINEGRMVTIRLIQGGM